MKIALWIGFAVLALLWTGGAAAVAQLVQWSAQGLAAGGAAPLSGIATGAALPAWLSAWVDPATWSAAQQAVAGALTTASESLPAIGTALGWLVPAVWVVWGLGLAALVGFTVLLAWLIARARRGAGQGPTHA